MTIDQLLKDKTKKAKERTETICTWLINGSISTDELLAFAEKSKDPEKATCIEAIEYATKLNPTIADESVFDFATKMLTENAPRIKWESAKVIGNIAHLFPKKLKKTISNLLVNSEYNGTVVRWASAYAIGEILKMETLHNKNLIPTVEALLKIEENNGVRKKYLEAFKKIKK